MKKHLFIGLLFSFFLSSCIQLRGLRDDYKHLSDEEKQVILPFKNDLEPSREIAYTLNAEILLKELQKHDKAMVYVFTWGCSSDACLPLTIYENYAKQNGYKIFFVLTSYLDLGEAMKEPINEPIYIIDSNYYGHKWFRKYVTFFENELKGLDKKHKENFEGNLFFYKNGKYQETRFYLPESGS
ncbi:hypothetical protein EG240_12730 [Paenimyroides tangerinum]|uniref:Uncharacterized protein n=1 Tax=Paenimyroides tangerinum TaxID=2488728 RepID=A0A3P3W525_9FLAO|nr:hypothetical protein [Paenimyroides tangerinum]RRJ89056.1 hypothetical protein EG240_12730 [Paenimyroides tangerinum]